MLLWVHCQFCLPGYKPIYIKNDTKHELHLKNTLFTVSLLAKQSAVAAAVVCSISSVILTPIVISVKLSTVF